MCSPAGRVQQHIGQCVLALEFGVQGFPDGNEPVGHGCAGQTCSEPNDAKHATL